MPAWLPTDPLTAVIDLEARHRQVGRNALFDHLDVDPTTANTWLRAWQRAIHRGSIQVAHAERMLDALGRHGAVVYGAEAWDRAVDDWQIQAGTRAPHGTTRRYRSKLYPCRCEACRAANAARVRAYWQASRRQQRPPRPLPPHGTLARYTHRAAPCHEACCRAANNAYKYQRKYGRPKRPRPPRQHGTRAMYQAGCTTEAGCPASPTCRQVHLAYNADYSRRVREIRARQRAA